MSSPENSCESRDEAAAISFPFGKVGGGILVLAFASTVTGGIFLVCTARLTPIDPYRPLIITALSWLAAVGVFAFSVSRVAKSFFAYASGAFLFSCPLLVTVGANVETTRSLFLGVPALADFSFWLSLVTVCVLTVVQMLRESVSDLWTRITAGLFLAWSIAFFFVSAGSSDLLPYAAPALRLAQVHFLLDLRIALSGLVLMSIGMRSAILALREPMPRPRPIHDGFDDVGTCPEPSSERISWICRTAVCYLKTGAKILADALWHLVAVVEEYSGRIILHSWSQAKEIFHGKIVVIVVGRLLLATAVVMSLAWSNLASGPLLKNHLRGEAYLLSTNENGWMAILVAVSLFVFGFVGVAIVAATWRKSVSVFVPAGTAAFIILFGWWCGVEGVQLLQSFSFSMINGFEHLGLLAGVLPLVAIALVLLLHLRRKKPAGSAKASSSSAA